MNASSGIDEGQLLRRVRRRLLLWSGGSTLALLLILGAALYLAVAGSLDATGTAQLRDRARQEIQFVSAQAAPVLPEGGVVFGGPASGTLAILVGSDARAIGPLPEPVEGLPNAEGVAAALAGREDVRKSTIGGTPVRILTTPVRIDPQPLALQIIQDRTAEERTLGVLLAVLAVGGLIALGLSLVAGNAYATRALIPIRNSLTRQREFAAEASHELRTPLAVIRTSVEHLRRHGDEPVHHVGTALDDIDAESQRLSGLVDDLLLLARTDSGVVQLAREPLDLSEIAAAALPSRSRLADSRGVRLELDPAPARLVGDSARMHQLIAILVDNAVQHSPARGIVRIRVRGPGHTTPRVSLEVEDDGPGIRAHDLPRVFERFWRAPDAPPGGSGLGLAIARWIVEQHGGTITAGNRLEGGARFTVQLPVDGT